MSELLTAAAAAAPLAGGWTVYSLRMRRRLQAAARDPLSGLLRREGFEGAAVRLLAGGDCSVLFIDLDGFKTVNDRFGHATGNAIIRDTGARLEVWAAGQHGAAGRLGGDEFAAVIPGSRHGNGLVFHLTLLHEVITAPVDHDGTTLTVGASIGAAWSADHPGADFSGLLRAADEAMYAAKAAGGGWRLAPPCAPPCESVNGRRAGRPGAHREAAGGGS
ncbi:GGDEF domain-containing protein [Streptomyces sp. DSM 44917]|uniref:GGDEF domain-containing protein n=1 Tax=Streptomyces boetiae TaxID=3075541 RepID=A0ABU2L6K8_9ACTN|nr:GGDEF domain-containing protein [Streptomyces sp. DSM 44917]MDT0307199.1 GGDEF domain-containing protein [Streptomyces sp. DSM 44917]